MSDTPTVTPVLISAEIMRFAMALEDPSALQEASQQLLVETDKFFEEKGLDIDPAVYVEITPEYGTAELPKEIPYAVTTVGVKLPHSYEESTVLLEGFEAPSFRYVRVRALDPEGEQKTRREFAKRYGFKIAGEDDADEADTAPA